MAIQANSLRSESYYNLAQQGSLDLKHPAILILKKYLISAKKVVDLGCGEGTRLDSLVSEDKEACGVDYNSTAIKIANKQYPKIKFIQADLAKLPLDNQSFDLAYSAYVLEHLDQPDEMLQQAVRILKKDGILILIAPNFGAPNRRSPNSKQSALVKLFDGYMADLLSIFRPEGELNWQKVQPKSGQYTIDADTVIEPYLLTLKKYTEKLEMVSLEFTSCWSEDRFSFFQLGFRILGNLGIYPFNYWGPHLCLVLRKELDE